MTDVQFQWRTDSEADWAAANPVLIEAEPGYESDTGRLKIGDGLTPWNDLDYFPIIVPPDYVICTSGTRPSPYEGLMIYETDTNRTLVYSGTGWVDLSAPATNTLVRVHRSNAFVLPAPQTTFIWPTVTYGKASLYNTATGIYTAPSSGFYRISGEIGAVVYLPREGLFIGAAVNGTGVDGTFKRGPGASGINDGFPFNFVVDADAGDQLSVHTDNSGVNNWQGVPGNVNTHAVFEKIG